VDSKSDDLEAVLGANLKLRSDLAVEVAKAVEPAAFGPVLNMEKGVFDWWRNRFGRSEDQPLIFVLLVFIAITLYVFI